MEDWIEVLKRKHLFLATIETKEARKIYGRNLIRLLKTCIAVLEEYILAPETTEDSKIFYAYCIEKLHKIKISIRNYISE